MGEGARLGEGALGAWKAYQQGCSTLTWSQSVMLSSSPCARLRSSQGMRAHAADAGACGGGPDAGFSAAWPRTVRSLTPSSDRSPHSKPCSSAAERRAPRPSGMVLSRKTT